MLVTDNILQIKDYLVDSLKAELNEVVVCNGFFMGQYYGELSKPLLSICLKQIKSQKDMVEGYVEVQENGNSVEEILGQNMRLVFALNLYTPTSYSESDCNKIFIEICQKLLFDSNYDFVDVIANEVEFDEKTQLFCSKISAELNVILTHSKKYESISGYVMNTKAE